MKFNIYSMYIKSSSFTIYIILEYDSAGTFNLTWNCISNIILDRIDRYSPAD